MISILTRAIMMSTPLLMGSIAEVYAERTGMMVTAIEGIFLLGAWGGFVGTYMTVDPVKVTVLLKQQQIVTGTAINILAGGFCAYFQRVLFGIPTTPLQISVLDRIPVPVLSSIPVIGPMLFNQNILTYFAYIVIPVSYIVLYRTSLGLAIRSAGENPEAADASGINVNRIRFLTVLAAGAMGGLAGSFYTIGYLGMFTTGIIGGRGWIAFAICFLGNWNPRGAMFGTLVFGLAEAISIYLQSTGGIAVIPNEFVIALPYILTIVLTIAKRNFAVPAKLGVPYIKES